MANRLTGPSWENWPCFPGVMVSRQTVSIASRRSRLQNGLPGGIHWYISSMHSSAVGAWKQASGVAMCIFISLMTIRCGRLLKMTKAVSRRKIHVKDLVH